MLKTYVACGQDGSSSDSIRGAKRKLSPQRGINGPLLTDTIQRIGKEHNQRAQSISEGSPILPGPEFVGAQFGLEANKPKPNCKDSIRAKKALARLRVAQDLSLSAVGDTKSVTAALLPITPHGQAEQPGHGEEMICRKYGDQQPRTSAKLQFTTMPLPEMGYQFKGSCSRDAGSSACQNRSESNPCTKLIHGE